LSAPKRDGLSYPDGGHLGYLMLPDSDDDPSICYQAPIGISISIRVCFDLLRPPRCIALRSGSVLRAVVPETPIDEHCDSG